MPLSVGSEISPTIRLWNEKLLSPQKSFLPLKLQKSIFPIWIMKLTMCNVKGAIVVTDPLRLNTWLRGFDALEGESFSSSFCCYFKLQKAAVVSEKLEKSTKPTSSARLGLMPNIVEHLLNYGDILFSWWRTNQTLKKGTNRVCHVARNTTPSAGCGNRQLLIPSPWRNVVRCVQHKAGCIFIPTIKYVFRLVLGKDEKMLLD